MNADVIRAQIKEVRDLGLKYGKLVNDRTLSFPVVAEIIDYYESDGEDQALVDAEATIAELTAKLNKSHGAAGGLTRRINKLEAALSETRNVKDNNARLARISSFAYELIAYCDQDIHKMVDETGESLTEHPLYIRLRAEIGIDEGEDE